jgi:exodeoxyribonuclease V alpha subunit
LTFAPHTHSSINVTELLASFEDAGLLEPSDRHIALTLARIVNEVSPEVILAAALAARGPRHGHVAVDLATVADTAVAEASVDPINALEHALEWPEPESWIAKVAASPLVTVVTSPRSTPEATSALLLSGSLLYLHKYWIYERAVARQLIDRTRNVVTTDHELGELSTAAALLTGQGSEDQLRAVTAGLSRGLTVLVGGPGTGKTTTVAAMVAEILSRSTEDETLRVALAAPTGKAAARLGEAFAQAADGLPPQLAARLQRVEASTIHRLLGVVWQSPTKFRHHRQRPLPHDLVIVDEASMISMPLMARLLDAIRPDARCVIVGDPGQLASIEAGSVLADIAASVDDVDADAHQQVIRLRHSQRFPHDSPIGRLARAISQGDVPSALAVLTDTDSAHAATGAVSWIRHVADINPLDDESTRNNLKDLWQPALWRVGRAAATGDAGGALRAMSEVRVLCAHRRGPFGVHTWNAVSDRWSQVGHTASVAPGVTGGSGMLRSWYPGKVVMITANNDRIGLFNGDLGVVISDHEHIRVAFEGPDGIRLFSPGQLDSIEHASAMTIHKSQGSEFDHVLVVLPPPTSRLATRELLYTGVTRAQRHMTLIGSEEAVATAIQTQIARASGLRSLLW